VSSQWSDHACSFLSGALARCGSDVGNASASAALCSRRAAEPKAQIQNDAAHAGKEIPSGNLNKPIEYSADLCYLDLCTHFACVLSLSVKVPRVFEAAVAWFQALRPSAVPVRPVVRAAAAAAAAAAPVPLPARHSLSGQ
jgi:hypothetical protein